MKNNFPKICQLTAVDFSVKHFLMPLIDEMIKKNWDVTIVCSDGEYIRNLKTKSYKIKTVPIARSLNPFLFLRSLILLYIFFKSEKFDIVHAHTPVASLIGRMAAKLAGVNLIIYTAHGFYFHEGMSKFKKFFYITLEKIAAMFTDLIFCQSKEDLNNTFKYNIKPFYKSYVIGNGVDINIYNPNLYLSSLSRKSLGIPNSAFVVGLIARLVKEKGVVEFLESVRHLSSLYKNLWFLIIGDRIPSDHNEDVFTELEITKKIMGNKLVLTGYRTDIPFLIASMNLFCLPSWREGMPRTIIESMMMGKPVLATNIRGSNEEVVHQKTGILIPVKSPNAITSGIEFFIKNKNCQNIMGAEGRKRALKHYNEMKVIQKQIRIIYKFFKSEK